MVKNPSSTLKYLKKKEFSVLNRQFVGKHISFSIYKSITVVKLNTLDVKTLRISFNKLKRANRTDMILLHSVASHRTKEGL